MPAGDFLGALTNNAASITNPFAATGSVAVRVGDLVYFVLAEQTALTAGAVTDNLGHTYTATSAGLDSGTVTARAYYQIVTVAGTLTSVSAVATASADNVVAIASVFAGPFLAIDANPGLVEDVASPFTCPPTGTMVSAPQLVVCFAAISSNAALTATAPNVIAGSQVNSAALVGLAIGFQRVAVTTTISPAWTGTNPTDDVLGTNSFRFAPVMGWEMAGLTNPPWPSPRGGGPSPT